MKVFISFASLVIRKNEACRFGEPGNWSPGDKSCVEAQRRRHNEIFGIHYNVRNM